MGSALIGAGADVGATVDAAILPMGCDLLRRADLAGVAGVAGVAGAGLVLLERLADDSAIGVAVSRIAATLACRVCRPESDVLAFTGVVD